MFDRVLQRQTDRLSGVGSTGAEDDDDEISGAGGAGDFEDDPFTLTKADLLGTIVSNLEDSAAWRELKVMVGLGAVKDAVKALAEVMISTIDGGSGGRCGGREGANCTTRSCQERELLCSRRRLTVERPLRCLQN